MADGCLIEGCGQRTDVTAGARIHPREGMPRLLVVHACGRHAEALQRHLLESVREATTLDEASWLES